MTGEGTIVHIACVSWSWSHKPEDALTSNWTFDIKTIVEIYVV